ncbi:MAG: hypothetical protein ACRENK_09870 [Gemmatimonadaceae bacterium]
MYSTNKLSLYAWRAVGAVLALLVVVPAYRLLASPDAGASLRGVIGIAELSRSVLVPGTIIVLAAGIVVSLLLGSSSIENRLVRLGRRLEAIPPSTFAFGCALVSAAITLGFSRFVLDEKPNLIDAMVQLLQARFLAAGHLAGPVNGLSEFWHLPNSLVTNNGWVSQYPPGYVLFLAIGLLLGVPQAVGPFFVGTTVLFTALAADRLLHDDLVTARLGVVMLALSPFLIGLAGAYMNHIGAAAFFSVAIFLAVLSLDSDKLVWAVLTGVAVGIVFSIRPLTAVIASIVVAVVWLRPADAGASARVWRFGRRSAAAVIGIAPIFLALGLYNLHFFGSPFRFGYVASQGSLVGLGFHRDPTGQMYGPVQALAFTSSDLLTFSLYLFETPIPAVLLVGVFFLFARRLSWGERVIALWALLPVLGNFFYWHHGSFMGPRMLNDATPGWALLTAISAVGLVRRIPREKTLGKYPMRSVLATTLILGWCGGVFFLAPQRLSSYGGAWRVGSRIKLPPIPTNPSLVFVHGAWTERVAMRLVSHGLRLDSLEVAMRYNGTCTVHYFALWYAQDPASRSRVHPPIDFNFLPHREPDRVEIADGDVIRVEPGVQMRPMCLRQIASDTLGIVGMAPLLWQTDLPGTMGPGVMVVRDMGPEVNSRIISRYPQRVPLVLYRPVKEGSPGLAPYAVGMRALWPGG